MSVLPIVAVLLPLLLAVLPGRWLWSGRLAPWSAMPALLLAVVAPVGTVVDLPWLLLGSRLGVDGTGRVFLLLTALVWLLAGWFAEGYLAGDARRDRFRRFYLVTLAGNLLLCVALDAGTFYLGFTLMTFAAYGLVVHSGTDEARRAGRVYLVMAVLGEGALLAGILFVVQAAGGGALGFAELAGVSPGLPAVLLLLLGFGVKVGLPVLHLWLPLAHPVAPAPASAVLSGVMLMAGVLGWLRFLPLGDEALPEAGVALMVAGVVGMFWGVVVGLAQRDAKVLLAYSSISQMGFLALGVGAGLTAPGAWPLLWSAVALYALHHALAKSALFLGVGVMERRGADALAWLGLALPALALAGAPLTAGALAKLALKSGLKGLPTPWPEAMAVVLPLAAVGTALLMLRLFALMVERAGAHGTGRGLRAPWGILLLAVILLPWWEAGESARAMIGVGALINSSWPLLAALGLWVLVRRWPGAGSGIPPGDILVWMVEPAATWFTRLLAGGRNWFHGWRAWGTLVRRGEGGRLRDWERVLRGWPLVSTLWLALLVAWVLLVVPWP